MATLAAKKKQTEKDDVHGYDPTIPDQDHAVATRTLYGAFALAHFIAGPRARPFTCL